MANELKTISKKCNQVEIINDVGDTSQYVLEAETRDAINAALAVNRPLLIWGEPGIGKSQLAKAAARELNRVFIPFVADAHTESRDLLWSLDAVARLAEAQIQNPENPDREAVALKNFIVPGALWWALNWKNAQEFVKYLKAETEGKDANVRKGSDEGKDTNDGKDDEVKYRYQPPDYSEPASPDNGAVVLIDEIDKADPSVPNGLLEALGGSRFHPQGLERAVEVDGVRPLVIITTNNERGLPDAFIRRCLSLHLEFPESEEAQKAFLLKRAVANFKELDEDSVLLPATEMLIEDRAYAEGKKLRPLPGPAEYFDLLRGIRNLQQLNKKLDIAELMQTLRRFTYQKHPDHQREPYQV